MEILAVILVIAVVVSLAVPIFRAVRFDLRNAQAKGSLKKLDQAIRTFYQDSRGSNITPTCFSGVAGVANCSNAPLSSSACTNRGATGIPSQTVAPRSLVDELFGCGYLNPKDFAGLPYKFHVCIPNDGGNNAECSLPLVNSYAVATGVDVARAGKKYIQNYGTKKYHMFINSTNMKLDDNSD